MAFIIVMTGAHEGDYYALDRGSNVIGRSEDLDIHILDMRISRKHMDICFDEGKQEYVAADMNSRHGVSINGVKIDEKMALADGDCITIGQTDLLFTLEGITDIDSALSRLRTGRLEFATIDMSASNQQEPSTGGVWRAGSRLQSLRKWAGCEKMTLAVVFTDMVGSTELTHNLGNELMEQIRRVHFSRARSIIEEYDGYEIKTNGDEFMVAFRTAANAFDFALDFFEDPGDQRVQIRVGVHIGPVTVEEHDVQGAAVSYAARVIGMAVDGGVWVSNEVKNHIDQEKGQHHKKVSWQEHTDCELKGFGGNQVLWSVKKNG